MLAKVVALAGLVLILGWGAAVYCFDGRRISNRRGAFYLLLISVACLAGVVSLGIYRGTMVLADYRVLHSGGIETLDVSTDPAFKQVLEAQSPPFSKPSSDSADDWAEWRDRLRSRLKDELYELDHRSGVDIHASRLRDAREGDLRRIELAVPAIDGDMIPAVVLLPAESDGPLPGVVVIPGHVGPDESGLSQLVLDDPSYQNSAARALAHAGFATIALELRGFGLRGPPNGFAEHRMVAYNAILGGTFYKKLSIGDIGRVVDLFLSLPEVDSDRVGMAGASLGGELTVEYAALDARIRAIAFHSHGGSTGPYRARVEPDGDQPHYCHVIPNANRYLRQEDPFLLLAPRPTQGMRGETEPFRSPEYFETLRRAWAVTGNEDDLELGTGSGGHEFFTVPAIDFFRRHLQPLR